MQTRNRKGEIGDEIGEAAFLLRCTQMGWVACRPCMEKQHYDYIVDTGRNLVRVQVKSNSAPSSKYRHRVNLGRGSHMMVPYTKQDQDIECFAIHLLPSDTWYIMPVEAGDGRVGMTFAMKEYVADTGYEQYCEDWAELDRPGAGRAIEQEPVDRRPRKRPRGRPRKQPTLDIKACAEECGTRPAASKDVRRQRAALAPPFHQKHMEIGRHRPRPKLPHHQRNLTAVVSGMVRHVQHQVRKRHFG